MIIGSTALLQSFGFGDHLLKIAAIFAFGKPRGKGLERVQAQKTLPKGSLLGTTDFHALAFLDGLNISRGFVQAAARSRIEPGESTAQAMHVQLAALHIFDVYVRNLEFAP